MPKSKHQIPGRVRATYEFIKANRERYRVPALAFAKGNGSFVYEASAELTEWQTVARLGQRPLLRRFVRESMRCAARIGVQDRVDVHRFSEPLHVVASAERLHSPR